MPIGPDDIARAVFKERFRGYDQGEVDQFLDRVAAGLAQLVAERDLLAQRLEESGVLAGRPVPATRGDEHADELLLRTLGGARETADEVLAEARRQAHDLLATARRQADAERARLHDEAARIVLAVEQLRRFRDDYRARLHAVMGEQLAALDRAGELPRVPPAVQDVIERAPAVPLRPAPPRDAVEAGWAPDEDEREQTGALEDHAPWEDAWQDPWPSPEPASGGGGES